MLASLRWKWAVPGITAALLAVTRMPEPSGPATNPHSLFRQTSVPGPVEHALRTACMNCHSDEHVWPWYAYVPVSSLLLHRDVSAARAHMDLSNWKAVQSQGSDQAAAAYSGICENLLSGAMPKQWYVLMHPEARLTKSQIDGVCKWAEKESMTILTAQRKP